MKTYGKPEKGVTYAERRGVYAVIFRDCTFAELGVMHNTLGRYFLPGGGMEAGETEQQCLRRELLEETGYTLRDIHRLGRARRYYPMRSNGRRPLLGIGSFYTARLDLRIQPPDESHEVFLWLETARATSALYHPHQAWAVRRALDEAGQNRFQYEERFTNGNPL